VSPAWLGSGRSELAGAIYADHASGGGAHTRQGTPCASAIPHDAIRHGISQTPSRGEEDPGLVSRAFPCGPT